MVRTCLVVGLWVLVGVSARELLTWSAPPARAGVEPVATLNGDVNGDGSLDISDASYLLQFLFRGGPAPVPLAGDEDLRAALARCAEDLDICTFDLNDTSFYKGECEASLQDCVSRRRALPATGQTQCFDIGEDGRWGVVPCTSSPRCEYQDGSVRFGCSMVSRFVDNGDGTISDNCTGLVWLREPADVDGDGRSTAQDYIRWCDALDFCLDLDFAGSQEWRLPNIRELQSLSDYDRHNPALSDAFRSFNEIFWSSTTHAINHGDAWILFSNVGLNSPAGKGEYHFVRAVRDAF